ncbi:MAG: AAA family ATPase [Alphaproteobacteria bacterium]|nr:AAA family ATPase [Alphaproteobacteria bacterium]MBL7099301.1 AAA family ATPase [Alphaproteobacteria bacterium]
MTFHQSLDATLPHGAQEPVVRFLSDPATYGQIEPIEVHSTHGSLVFLTKSHAYKMKRAVRYPYMDYSTAQRRRAMCELELAVNRRTAPQLYESVMSIVPWSEGFRLGLAEEEGAVEWVVVMKRFRQEDLLEQRRRAGVLTLADMTAVGEAIAAFHQSAEVTRSFGGIAGLREVVEENIAMLRDAADVLSPALAAQYAQASEQWLRRLRAKLGWRRITGMVRRCHGDLHLNNICLMGGKPLLFDAIEFDDAFANIDTGFDLAFLLMDLDSHGMRPHANAVLNRYLERTRDYDVLGVLPLLLATRAALRAHIAVAKHRVHAEEDGVPPQALLERALEYLHPPKPMLVAIGGLSGSGKSTVAALAAPMVGAAPGAVVLRTDVIRKAMFGVSETTRLNDSAYDEATTASVYDELNRLAVQALHAGHSVIADAVFGAAHQRAHIQAAAFQAGVSFRGIWLTAPRPVLEARLAARKGDASDADAAVLAKQLAAIADPDDWHHVENARAAPSPDSVLAHLRMDPVRCAA